ncbi:Methyl-accepting chemotaxis protein [Pseudodesulfovibrio profundus]|jgi:hypothetical protein|uniref:Methyl-accepting chemotaxis protein n=1 Tax=Pseudodesulfovibrio profundus TaxID=57320 RepID=A0A2C8F7M5_9BACT|nr:DUF4391 domain-containing protein [Pseudodesulfovibrio profundus]SOB58034.1 Methyl-accepting chemotaxis protein [Pseudodesulfovibrio profundus]
MKVLYHFPKAATFGRVLPKSKIYDFAKPGKKVKDRFVQEVEKITWAYKLSPETINIPANGVVREIQVITIALKLDTLSQNVLQTIDKAIPSPLFFVLGYNGKTRYAAAYKRPSEADKSKWVVGSYFESEWTDEEAAPTELPVALNMDGLYQSLLKRIAPLPLRKGESLGELATRVDELKAKERTAQQLEARMKKEKQFNRKVEMNRTLNLLNQEIDELQL